MKKSMIKVLTICMVMTMIISYAYCQNIIGKSQPTTTKASKVAKPTRNMAVVNNTIPSNWKTYTNNKYGFTFQYPSTWSKYGEEANTIDRSGTIIAIKINFIDTVSLTTLLIDYHLAPKGVGLYQYAVSQYNSSQGWYAKGGEQIEVAGNKAIQAFTTITINGKGNPINPPLRLILVDFLDKQQTGAIELQFKTPLPNDNIEVAKFKRLLSTFKF